MKVGRFILKAGIWFSLVIFFGLSAVFLSVWTWPATIINTKNFERAVGFLGKHGMVIKYETADLKAESHSFFEKWIGFGAKKFCFVSDSMGMNACFETAKLSAAVNIKGWLPKYHAGPITLRGGSFVYHPKPSDKKEEKKKVEQTDDFWPTPPGILQHVAFDTVDIEVLHIDYVDGKMRVEGGASLEGRNEGKGSKWTAKLDAGLHLDKDPYSAKGTVTLQSVDDAWFGPYIVDTDLSGTLPQGKRVSLALHGKPKDKNALDFALDAGYHEKGRSFIANIIGKGDKNGVDGILSGNAMKLAENLPRVQIQECELSAKQEPKKGKHFVVNCPANLTGYFPRFKNGPYEKIFEKIKLVVKADMRLQDLKDKPGSLSGKFELSVDPFFNQINEGRAAMTTNISGLVADFPNQLRLDSDLKIGVREFQRVVKMSQHYPWAIPEPANSLKGTIDLHVTGKGELMREGGELPIEFKTRLSSEGQVLNLDGDGKLKLKPLKGKEAGGAHLDFTLVLSEVQMMLPHLSVEAPPRLAPDTRIKRVLEQVKKTVQKEVPKSSFSYNVQVVTPNGQPLRLVSNLAKDKVPIAIFLHGTDKEPFNGSVRVLAFPVELFRRTATIKHLDIRMAPNSKDSEISGLIQVVHTDYTINIKLLGLLDQPQIKFTSEPPLPEDKVIAVLLFGKLPGQLTADQSASVGSTKAAVEDSAVTLASMYLLASTPVESVGYDPVSHVFMAKVRLADGTSLNVGSDMTQLNQIGIRKQLGGHWTVTTYLEHPLDPVARSLSAFLEWTKGY